ncbi:hypothetical protein V6R98_02095 [Agrobacterium sp. CCNWLW71]|uniref:hypothetical protein n=1 Tax=unclassified Agrobacterium TaxID=2632611 RepID=UPI002FF30108
MNIKRKLGLIVQHIFELLLKRVALAARQFQFGCKSITRVRMTLDFRLQEGVLSFQ